MARCQVGRDQATHRVAEHDLRQRPETRVRPLTDKRTVGDDAGRAILRGEAAWRGIRRPGGAVAAVIVRDDMEAKRRQLCRKPAISAGVLGKPVLYQEDAARVAGRFLASDSQMRAAWARRRFDPVEPVSYTHLTLPTSDLV